MVHPSSPSQVPENASRETSLARRILRATADELGEIRPVLHLVQGVSGLLPQLRFNRLRTALYRAARVSVGANSLLMGQVILTGSSDPALFSVGESTYITGPLRVDLGGAVRIGSGVNIGHDCFFLTVDHKIGSAERRAGERSHGSIVIEDGVWIASRVTILPGRTIGRGAVVAAGAVVTADVAPNTLVGGVPARVLRRLEP